MPKRLITDAALPEANTGELATWQATGLSLAVAGLAVANGIGVLVAAPVAALVIWSLARLRRSAPEAESIAELVGSTLGGRAAWLTRALQVLAYLLLGTVAARTVGIMAVAAGLSLGSYEPDDAEMLWLWAAWSVAAVVVAALLCSVLSSRSVATVAAALAAAGLLTYFYVALAMLAKAASGTPPVPIAAPSPPSALAATSVVVGLAMGLVGFEVAMVVGARLRSPGRPLAWAVAAVTGCALTGWVAVNLGSSGAVRYGSDDLGPIAVELFGPAILYVLAAAFIAIGTSALLVLLWAMARLGPGTGTRVAVAVTVAALVVVECLGWGGLDAKLAPVATLVLLIVYLAVAEANSRLDAASTLSWSVKTVIAAVLALVVVVPLLAAEDRATALWPVAITAGMITAAAVFGGAVARRGRQSHPPR